MSLNDRFHRALRRFPAPGFYVFVPLGTLTLVGVVLVAVLKALV